MGLGLKRRCHKTFKNTSVTKRILARRVSVIPLRIQTRGPSATLHRVLQNIFVALQSSRQTFISGHYVRTADLCESKLTRFTKYFSRTSKFAPNFYFGTLSPYCGPMWIKVNPLVRSGLIFTTQQQSLPKIYIHHLNPSNPPPQQPMLKIAH